MADLSVARVQESKRGPKSKTTSRQRIPQLYCCASRILRDLSEKRGSIKNLVYSSKYPNVKVLFALVYKVLQQIKLLNSVIECVEDLKNYPKFDKFLSIVLVYEMLFRKIGPPCQQEFIQLVWKYKTDIESIFWKLEKKSEYKKVDQFDYTAQGTLCQLPRYARINTILTSVSDVIKQLQQDGFEFISYDRSVTVDCYLDQIKSLKRYQFFQDLHFPDLLVFCPGENISQVPAYRNGHIFLADKSSYLPVTVLAPVPASFVFDSCAAPGLKTVHLAGLMQNTGKIFATDMNKTRFHTLKSMLSIGGVKCCEVFCEDFTKINPTSSPFSSVEYILVDPSCSGSGMVSRLDLFTDDENSKKQERIAKLARFQIVLLKHALSFPNVRRVVYSTCSTSTEENEYVIKEALSSYSHAFKISNAMPQWLTRGSSDYEFGHFCLRAYPSTDLTNGFFVALLERINNTVEEENDSLGVNNIEIVADEFGKKDKCLFSEGNVEYCINDTVIKSSKRKKKKKSVNLDNQVVHVNHGNLSEGDLEYLITETVTEIPKSKRSKKSSVNAKEQVASDNFDMKAKCFVETEIQLDSNKKRRHTRDKLYKEAEVTLQPLESLKKTKHRHSKNELFEETVEQKNTESLCNSQFVNEDETTNSSSKTKEIRKLSIDEVHKKSKKQKKNVAIESIEVSFTEENNVNYKSIKPKKRKKYLINDKSEETLESYISDGYCAVEGVPNVAFHVTEDLTCDKSHTEKVKKKHKHSVDMEKTILNVDENEISDKMIVFQESCNFESTVPSELHLNHKESGVYRANVFDKNKDKKLFGNIHNCSLFESVEKKSKHSRIKKKKHKSVD